MRVIGITGAIGAGKSTVLRWLATHGARTVDADALVHHLYETDGDLQALLEARFGPDVVVAGRVDRLALRRVFAVPGALADLERIVHPAVQRVRDRLIDEARQEGVSVFALEAIRLVESGGSARCDELWIVVATPEVQLARLLARGMDAAEARRRFAVQGSITSWTEAFLSESQRLGRSRPVVVFDNSGTPDQGEAQVQRFWSGL